MRKLFCIAFIACATVPVFAQLNFSGPAIDLQPDYKPLGFCTMSGSVLCAVGTSLNGTPLMHKSVDGGFSWTPVSISGISHTIYKCICNVGNQLLMGAINATTGKVYASSDGGNNWSLSSSGLATNFIPQDFFQTSSNDVYVLGMHLNTFNITPGLYFSTDAGASWTVIPTSGVGSDQWSINAICHTGSILLMATNDVPLFNTVIYSSSDGGQTWTPSDNGVPQNFLVMDLLVKSPSKIYAIGSQAVGGTIEFAPKFYVSTDGGSHWNLENHSGVDSVNNFYNTACLSGTNIILGAGKRSENKGAVYSTGPINVSSLKESAKEETGISSFPNPANTDIKINLSRTYSDITLEIIDVKGRCVLKQHYNNTANLKVELSSLAKGTYVLKLQYENASWTKKILKE